MAQAIPVNNNILKWARETSGLSVDHVARKINKSVDVIVSWEKGVSSPTYPQLEKLAYDIYKRPTAVFFFPSIPHESSPRAEFRTLPEEEVDSMPPEIIKLYKKAKVYQFNLKELDTQNNLKMERLIDTFNLIKTSEVVSLAKEVRNFLNIDFQTQASWKSIDDAIEEWRNALVNRGIYIFKDAFKDNHYSGLSLYDVDYPVILINNSMPKTRQVFTIFHEIGHLLLKAGGIDALHESFYSRLHPDYYIIEQKCNEFAGEFLLPFDLFKELHTEFSEKNLIELADTFKVSREVILRKYLNFNLITPEIYRFFSEKWVNEFLNSRNENNNDDSGGNPYYTKISYLGLYYINLVFSQYYQGKIDVETLSDYLNIKVGNVPTFEGYVLR